MAEGYIAYVITPESRAELLKRFPPHYPEVIAHHITRQFGAIPADVPVTPRHVKIVGYHDSGAIQVLVVDVDGLRHQVPRDGETTPCFLHITLSLDRTKGVEPKDSNAVLQRIANQNGAAALDNLAEPFAISVTPQFIPKNISPPKPSSPQGPG